MIKVFLTDVDERFITKIRQLLIKYDSKFQNFECIVFNADSHLLDELDSHFVRYENYL
jgi:hypothetical protein